MIASLVAAFRDEGQDEDTAEARQLSLRAQRKADAATLRAARVLRANGHATAADRVIEAYSALDERFPR
jgi:hypothetical protein